MSWLLRDGEVLAALEVADTRRARRRGLIGRDDFEGALLLTPARSIHTFGMRFPIDVAYCDGALRVLETVCMARSRLGAPRLRARCVIEAQRGAFERWGLRPGDQLEIKGL
jgi:uncharacterized membrane protein (UPF0127 family)